MGKAIIAIGCGAALGAWLRWFLGMLLNALYPPIPMGTVAANVVGGYVIGMAIAFFSAIPQLAPEWRLFVITGFCGGLTTFSTFSAEVVALLQQQRWLLACGAIALHVGASLAATFAGIASWQWLRSGT